MADRSDRELDQWSGCATAQKLGHGSDRALAPSSAARLDGLSAPMWAARWESESAESSATNSEWQTAQMSDRHSDERWMAEPMAAQWEREMAGASEKPKDRRLGSWGSP